MRRSAVIGLALMVALLAGGCPYVTDATVVQASIETSLGTIVVELDPINAPVTVANFRQYADQGFYAGTIFHRIEPDFVIQGGGFTPDLEQKETGPPIQNESFNGLSNLRGTIGMARSTSPDSATAQFYINLEDNTALDATLGQPGYTVFGRVVEGLDVVDTIAAVETSDEEGQLNVPVEPVLIERVTVTEDVVGLRLSDAGEVYVDSFPTRAAGVIRDLIVDLVGFAIYPGFGS